VQDSAYLICYINVGEDNADDYSLEEAVYQQTHIAKHSSSQTHVPVNASFVDKRIDSNFVAMAECAIVDPALPIAVADDYTMRYEITYNKLEM
jgi:hypothetical protein